MFARILEFIPKVEMKDELIKKVRLEVLPILRKQPGFLELLPFDPEIVKEKAIVVTLWTDKREAEKYDKELFPKVEQIVKPFLTTPITVKMYNVETTLCEHLVEMLAHAA